jgi:hypothetical protein
MMRKRCARTLASVVGWFALTAGLAGCVAVDGRSWKEPVAKSGAAGMSGRFAVRAAYISERMGMQALNRLDRVLQRRPAEGADVAVLSFRENEGLSVRFERGGVHYHTVDYRFDAGLKITDDGKLELPGSAGCGGQDTPGVGCASSTITLFRNPSGDLVAVQSTGAAGILGIFPIGVYGRMVSIFPEVVKDACDFVRRGIYSCQP